MSHMFDNYPQPSYYIPNNRKCHFPEEVITIMTGETTVHSFDIPFDVDNETLSYRALYKLGLDIVLIKEKEECDVLYENGVATLTWVLSPNETLLFKDTLLDTRVQLEFVMQDHSISYTNILEVKVIDSLNKGEV